MIEVHPRRDIVDAILYVNQTGCAWRYLPVDFPPWQTVYWHFRRWESQHVTQRIVDVPRRRLRRELEREAEPSAAVTDSQSVKGADTVGKGSRGHDAGKKTAGRKRFLLTDTQGLLLGVMVVSASVQDRVGATTVLLGRVLALSCRLVFADQGFSGRLVAWARAVPGVVVHIVGKPPGQKGFVVHPRRWVVEPGIHPLKSPTISSKTRTKAAVEKTNHSVYDSDMNTVISKDGTKIAYEKFGTGPAVILVGGGLDSGSENRPLATELATSFTVINYSRRGRGKSGDTLPYALEREIEDIEALIEEVGGSAHLYGVSSGGALVLEAAIAGVKAEKLAVHEVPYSVDKPSQERWNAYATKLDELLADDRREDALELFMHLAGSSDEIIEGAKNSPYWEPLTKVAPTLAYDARCMGDGTIPKDRLEVLKQPALVLTGSVLDPAMGNLQPGFFDDAADALAASLPNAERKVVEGQSHQVDPKAMAPILEAFFR